MRAFCQGPQLLLDAEQAAEFGQSLRAREGSGPDLPDAGRHGELGDAVVLCLSGSKGEHAGELCLPRRPDGLSGSLAVETGTAVRSCRGFGMQGAGSGGRDRRSRSFAASACSGP